jgi:hypothetical protein
LKRVEVFNSVTRCEKDEMCLIKRPTRKKNFSLCFTERKFGHLSKTVAAISSKGYFQKKIIFISSFFCQSSVTQNGGRVAVLGKVLQGKCIRSQCRGAANYSH